MGVEEQETILQTAELAYADNPDNLQACDKYAQLLIKYNHIAQAETFIEGASILQQSTVEARSTYAYLRYKLKKYDDADDVFDALIKTYPTHQKLRLLYAQTLKKRRKLIKAYETIQPLDMAGLKGKQRDMCDEIIHIFKAVAAQENRPLDHTDDFGILSMKHAILHFKTRKAKRPSPPELGKVSLITGTLGAGGAEKQLCLTAIHLNEKMRMRESVAGCTLNQPVDVLINLYDTEEKRFFLPLLRDNQVTLFQVKDLPVTPLEKLGIDSTILFHFINESPSMIRYGVTRLVQYFREAKTDTVFVWQDGAILFTVLAALITDVPHIVLNLRGYPPIVRPHLFKPEYDAFYKALSHIPAVSFVTNTHATAVAYADWLGISPDRFTVIYNGIAEPSYTPLSNEEMTWANFVAQTPDASETIGGVFRFESDKRPILVIRFIKRYLQKHPHARFILVGEGRLRQQCMDLSAELGILNRILFIGLSRSVGFWMSKMDVMVLMSLYEGLPNVLIEAQYMGVPVVSTPAGGAGECFIEGETGFILSDATDPDLFEACDKVSTMVQRMKDNPTVREKAKRFAASHFSISGMIERTVRTLGQHKAETVCDAPA